jgi:ubiquinone/menaquinone biosynthesis C-methylase UbiE
VVKKGILEDVGCPWWICWSFDNPLRRLIHNPRRMMQDLVEPGNTALDLGCGEGYFTMDIARLAGSTGRVYAVDLQEHMLRVVRRRAVRAGVSDQIETILGSPAKLELPAPVDFVLAFWMLHEVPDKERLLTDLFAAMKPGGRFLLVEPKWHVSRESFDYSLQLAEQAGLVRVEDRSVALSMATLLTKP